MFHYVFFIVAKMTYVPCVQLKRSIKNIQLVLEEIYSTSGVLQIQYRIKEMDNLFCSLEGYKGNLPHCPRYAESDVKLYLGGNI